MAVYTKINKKDISYINRKFEIEKFINFKGIKQGIENTVPYVLFQFSSHWTQNAGMQVA